MRHPKNPSDKYEGQAKGGITATEADTMLAAMPAPVLAGDPPCPCPLCASARAEGLI